MFKVNFSNILKRIGQALFPIILAWAIEFFLASIDTKKEREDLAKDLASKIDLNLPFPLPDSVKEEMIEQILAILYDEFKTK